MKRSIITAIAMLILSGCVHQSAIPLGNDMMEIDVSASSHYGRAGAMEIAFNKAASATLAAGYDKFIVVNDNGWNESGFVASSYGNYNATGGQAGGFAGTVRHPEAKLIIRMYHDGDKGSAKAVDAREVLKQQDASH